MMPPEIRNILADLPGDRSCEVFEILAAGPTARIERIVSRGHITPEGTWYDQEQEEWVLLIAGAARIQFEDNAEISLNEGDHLYIPSHGRHRVTWTDPDRDTIWVAVHFSPSALP